MAQGFLLKAVIPLRQTTRLADIDRQRYTTLLNRHVIVNVVLGHDRSRKNHDRKHKHRTNKTGKRLIPQSQSSVQMVVCQGSNRAAHMVVLRDRNNADQNHVRRGKNNADQIDVSKGKSKDAPSHVIRCRGSTVEMPALKANAERNSPVPQRRRILDRPILLKSLIPRRNRQTNGRVGHAVAADEGSHNDPFEFRWLLFLLRQ